MLLRKQSTFRLFYLPLLGLLIFGNPLTTESKEYSLQESQNDFKFLMTAFGALTTDNFGRSKSDSDEISDAMGKVNSMIHGVTGRDGAPPFMSDAEGIAALEQIYVALGPLACQLPHATQRELDQISSVLGGLLGNVIGNLMGNNGQGNGNGNGNEQMLSMLTGFGGIAGALGGMTGGMIDERGFSDAMEQIPRLTSGLGDMKILVDGDFNPPAGLKAVTSKVEKPLTQTIERMGSFMKKAGSEVKNEFGIKETTAFSMRLRGISSDYVNQLLAVSGMAGTIGGLIASTLPKPSNQNPASSTRAIKSSLKKMRAFSRGRSILDQNQVFEGLLDDLSLVSAEMGAIGGVMGGLMGRTMANSTHSYKEQGNYPPGEFDDYNGGEFGQENPLMMIASMFGGNSIKKITNAIKGIDKKLEGIMPANSLKQPSHQTELCMKFLAIGLGQISMMSGQSSILPGALDFKGPYGDQGDKVTTPSLRRALIGSEWGGSWNGRPKKWQLQSAIEVAQLSTLEPDLIEDNSFLRYVDKLALTTGKNSRPILFLQGDIMFDNLLESEKKMIPITLLKSQILDGITAKDRAMILLHSEMNQDPKKVEKFLNNLPEDEFDQLVVQIENQQGSVDPHKTKSRIQHIMAEVLFDRKRLEVLCPFVHGLSVESIHRLNMEDVVQHNLYDCFINGHLKPNQKRAFVEVMLGRERNSTEILNLNITSLIQDIPAHYFANIASDDAFIQFVKASNLVDYQGRGDQHDSIRILMKLNQSNTNIDAGFLNKLGNLLCGAQTEELSIYLDSAVVKQYLATWEEKCFAKHETMKENQKTQRFNRMQIFNAAREYINNTDLTGLNGELAADVIMLLPGFTVSELQQIPSAVLNVNFNMIAESVRLSKQQIGAIWSKLVADGLKANNETTDLSSLHDFVSQLQFTPAQIKSFSAIPYKDGLFWSLTKSEKLKMTEQLLSTSDIDTITQNQPYLSYSIPTSIIKQISTSNMTMLSQSDWSKSQGLAIVNKYKEDRNKESLSVDDIEMLGSAAIGLTCKDVIDFPLDAMLEVAQALDKALQNSITPDLANCVAMKLYLSFKMLRPDMDKQIARHVPGNILLLMPVSFLESYAYAPNCDEVVNKIGRSNLNLLSLGPGSITLDALSQMAKTCLNEMSRGFNQHYDLQPQSRNTNQYDQYTTFMPYNKSKDYNYGNFSHYNSYNDYGNNNYSNYDNGGEYYHQPSIGPRSIRIMQRLACNLKLSFMELDTLAMYEFMKILPQCIGIIDRSGIEVLLSQVNHVLFNGGQSNQGNIEVLAPIFPLSGDRFIGLSDEALIDALKSLPSLKFYKPRYMQITSDRSSKQLTLDGSLLLDLPTHMQGESNASVLDFNPVKFKQFAEFAAPRAIDYLGSMGNPLNENDTRTAAMTYENLMILGPAVVGLKRLYFEMMDNNEFMNSLALLGKAEGWNSTQLTILREKLLQNAGIGNLSRYIVDNMGSLVNVFTLEDIYQLNYIPLNNFARVLTGNKFREAALYRYLQTMEKSVQQISGFELTEMDSLLCGIGVDDITKLSAEAVRFSVRVIGKIRCFSETHLMAFKDKVKGALDQPLNHPTVLKDIGILAAAMTILEFSGIKPIDSSLLSSDALRIVPTSRIIDGWSVNHLAQMGTENGAAVIARTDMFSLMSNQSRNAVFRSAFGTNAAYMSSMFEMMMFGDEMMSENFEPMLNDLMKSTEWLFTLLFSPKRNRPKKSGPGAVYGLTDPASFVKPPPPELAGGLKQDDFKNSLNTNSLKDRQVIEFINKASGSNQKILAAIKGDVSVNTLSEKDIKTMPAKIFNSMKNDQIKNMTGDTLSKLFDSDAASQDPMSLTKILRKLDDDQLNDAIAEINSRVITSSSDTLPYRVPINIQKVIVKEFVDRLKKLSPTNAIDSFCDNMCAFSAGLTGINIKDIPMVVTKVQKVLDCFEESYDDFTDGQKKQIIKWAQQDRLANIDITSMNSFILDLPQKQIKEQLTSEKALAFVQAGKLKKLNILHNKFKFFSKYLMRKILETNTTSFGDSTFMDNLGHSKCEIPLAKVKSQMSASLMLELATYTMSNCQDAQDMMEKTLEECTGSQAIRLQRCQILKETAKQNKQSAASSNSRKPEKEKIDIDQFKMMRTLADTLIADKDLTQMGSTELISVAGALGGLTNEDMDKIPDDTILLTMNVLKENKNLSPKQKKLVLRKAKKAGFTLSDPESLASLGELVSEVPTEDLKKLPLATIKQNLGQLKDKARSFSRSQKKAIMAKLQEGSVEDMLSSDIGTFAEEITLNKLETMEEVNLTMVNTLTWDRGQAAKLVEMYRNNTSDDGLSAEIVSEMGNTVVGLKCSDVMEMNYDEMLQMSVTIDNNVDMTPDMDECEQNKLDYSLKIEHGVDYITNETNQEIPEIVETIPSDIAFFYPPEVAATAPQGFCQLLFQQIGTATMSDNPSVAELSIRKYMTEAAINCTMNDPDHLSSFIEEEDVLILSNLICDANAEAFGKLTEDGFTAALLSLQKCAHRLNDNQILEIRSLVDEYIGDDTSLYDATDLESLGPIVNILSSERIQAIDPEAILEAYDSIINQWKGDDETQSSNVNTLDVDNKAREAFLQGETTNRRKRRETSVPDYDTIVALGPKNSGWSVDVLLAINDNDLINALDVFGDIDNWSTSQRKALLEKLTIGELGTLSTWDEDTISDAKHLLTDLTVDQIELLDLASLETMSALAEVNWDNSQRKMAFDRYRELSGLDLSDLTAEDIAGLGEIFCGLTDTLMASVSINTIINSIKDLGSLDCYNQLQLDALYSLVYISLENNFPDAATIQQMGTITAGMKASDLEQIPISSMSFIDPRVFRLIEPTRIRDGFSESQFAVSGTTNVAAMISVPELYRILTPAQQNVLQIAAFGNRARLVDESGNGTGIDIFAGDGDENLITEKPTSDNPGLHYFRFTVFSLLILQLLISVFIQ